MRAALLVVVILLGLTGSASAAVPTGGTAAGTCVKQLPTTQRAGDVLAIQCRYATPTDARTVVVSPAFSDAFADPTYVLQPGLDYGHQVDLDSGNLSEFVVLVRILRDVVAPFRATCHAVLFTYLAVTR